MRGLSAKGHKEADEFPTNRRTLSVEKRWLGSVISSLILSTFIVGIVVQQVLTGFTPMNSVHYLVVLVCAAIILALSIIAFVDYFAVELNVHVRRQVSISKKEMMARKRLGKKEETRTGRRNGA